MLEMFLIILAAILTGLKIANLVQLSWWLILLPLYIDILFWVLVIFGIKTSESIGSIFSFVGRKKKMNEIMDSFEESQKFKNDRIKHDSYIK